MQIISNRNTKTVNRSTNLRGLNKEIPQNDGLEQAVLGALLLEKHAIEKVSEILKPESFYKKAHQLIYQTIFEVYNESNPVDLISITNKLRDKNLLTEVGGSFYVSELTMRVNSSANVEFHAWSISEYAIRRKLIEVFAKIENDVYEDSIDVFELLAETDKQLFEVTNSNSKKNYESMKTLMQKAFSSLEERRNKTDGLTGIPSGFTALDRVTSGWQKSDLIIMAARPGMGKTSMVVSALRNAAVDFNVPVVIFSLEMSAVQLVNRLISSEASIESDKIKKGQLSPEEWSRLVEKTGDLNTAPIFIDDTPALSILELRAKCKRLKQQQDIQMVIVDYLQLMTGSGSNNGGNREQEIASISRGLKNLAKELEVPVIALSQLSRAVETRGGDKRPQLSDLRESGSIEQDADMVAFLYRPEYYGIMEDEYGVSTINRAEVIIAKHRNGTLDIVPLQFTGAYTRFSDINSDYGVNELTYSSKLNYNTPDNSQGSDQV